MEVFNMETVIKWIKVIARILLLIAEGLSKEDAVRDTAASLNISEAAIWKHGGF